MERFSDEQIKLVDEVIHFVCKPSLSCAYSSPIPRRNRDPHHTYRRPKTDARIQKFAGVAL